MLFLFTFAACERVGLRSENRCPIARILCDEISLPLLRTCVRAMKSVAIENVFGGCSRVRRRAMRWLQRRLLA